MSKLNKLVLTPVVNSMVEFMKIFDSCSCIEDLIEQSKSISFVQPLAISISKNLIKNYPDEFNKVFFFWITTLTLKLDDGDICVKFDKETLKTLYIENICQRSENIPDYIDEELWDHSFSTLDAAVDEFLDMFLDSSVIKKAKNIISDSPDTCSPLIAFHLSNPAEARIYFRSFYLYEQTVAHFIKENNTIEEQLDPEYEKYLTNSLNILFDANTDTWQKVAAASSAISKFSVICGGPGTGKTTTVLKLLILLLANKGAGTQRIKLAAPTGKAASRMLESINNQLNRDDIQDLIRTICNEEGAIASPQDIIDAIPKQATTVHRLLKVIPHKEVPVQSKENPLPCEILVVDEVSMISIGLFAKLVDAIGPQTKVIMLGDKDQLCSVEPGKVLADICSDLSPNKQVSESRIANISKITGYKEELLRQKHSGSMIVGDYVSMLIHSWRFNPDSKLGKLAALVNDSQIEAILAAIVNVSQIEANEKPYLICEQTFDIETNSTKLFVEGKEVTANFIADDPALRRKLGKYSKKIADYSINFYTKDDEYLDFLISKKYIIDNPTDAKKVFERLDKYRILCSNRQGELGTIAINEKMYSAVKSLYLNTQGNVNGGYVNPIFYPGAVILITQNDNALGVDNGDVGFVAFDKDGKTKVFFTSVKEDNEPREISPERLSNFDYGFAMTIHKSQGSEYQNVCMVLGTRLNPVLTKELIYTGLTRAKSIDVPDANDPSKKHTVGGLVSIISSKKVFMESIKKEVKRDSGLSIMLN